MKSDHRDVRINSSLTSRKHARVRVKDGAAAVADDSRYGTYLNGERAPASQSVSSAQTVARRIGPLDRAHRRR